MKRLIIFLLLFAAIKVAGQTTGYLRFDTVKIMKQNGTCELYIINATKDSLGLLTNVGGGLTRFVRSRVLNDSTLIVGRDTLVIKGGAGSGGSGSADSTIFATNYRVDTAKTNLRTQINTKVNISDTATMLTPYSRGTGTAGQVAVWNGTRSITGDPGLTYNSTTNALASDTGHFKTVQADENLLAPIRDTLGALARRGALRFDTVSNAITYYDGAKWNFIESIVGELPNVQLAAGVVRGIYNSGSGTTDWEFIINGTHDSIFFTGVNTTTSQLHITYPAASKVITFIAVPDEGLAPWLTMGASVGTTEAVISLWQKRGMQGGLIRGNANDTFSLDGTRMLSWDIDYTQATGQILLTPSVTSPFWEQTDIVAEYVGTNAGFHLERIFAGIPSGWAWAFTLVDAFGNAVTDPVSTADAIQVQTSIPWHTLLSPGGGGALQQALFGASTNVWLFAIYQR